jgi:recombination protein RecR
MTPAYDQLVQMLKKLPGLGFRSAEKIALHLLVENREKIVELTACMQQAAQEISRCQCCGNIAEHDLCVVCSNPRRDARMVCVVESIQDLLAIEKSGAYEGRYHVLFGKLSPLKGVGPSQLNLSTFWPRVAQEEWEEVVLALANDLEGEATCHWLQEKMAQEYPQVRVSRIGFGLPSGSALLFADGPTLKSALSSRRRVDQSGD